VAANRIDVAWIDNADDEDGFRVRSRGKKAGQPDHAPQPITTGADARTASLTGLLSGYEYTITVVAFNTIGESGSSNAVLATVPDVSPPAFITAGVVRDPELNVLVLSIGGRNFQPAEFVDLQITTRDGTDNPYTETDRTTSDSNGNIQYKYAAGCNESGPHRSFEVKATGVTSSKHSNVANAGCPF
jgi:hypothetical protein